MRTLQFAIVRQATSEFFIECREGSISLHVAVESAKSDDGNFVKSRDGH